MKAWYWADILTAWVNYFNIILCHIENHQYHQILRVNLSEDNPCLNVNVKIILIFDHYAFRKLINRTKLNIYKTRDRKVREPVVDFMSNHKSGDLIFTQFNRFSSISEYYEKGRENFRHVRLDWQTKGALIQFLYQKPF